MGLSHFGLNLLLPHSGDWGEGTPLPGREFDGVSGGIDVWSLRLAANFDGNEGAVFGRASVASGVWTDGDWRYRYDVLFTNTNNRISSYRNGSVDGLRQSYRNGDGTSVLDSDEPHTTLEYTAVGILVSVVANTIDHVKIDGGTASNTATSIVTALTDFTIGSVFGATAGIWHGSISHVVTFFEALDATQRDAVWTQLDSGGITPAWIEANVSDNFVLWTLWPDSIDEEWGTGTLDGLFFSSTGTTITPAVTLAAGAPTPEWTVIEGDGSEFTYNTAAFSHTKTDPGNMNITLAAPVLPFVEEVLMGGDNLIGTLNAANFLAMLPILEYLDFGGNSSLICDWDIADMPNTLTTLRLFGTESIIYGDIADFPPNMMTCLVNTTDSVFGGDLSDLPSSFIIMKVKKSLVALTGSFDTGLANVVELDATQAPNVNLVGTLDELPASIIRLFLTSATLSIATGGISPISCTNIDLLYIDSLNMSQAQVDDCFLRIWTDRALFTAATHSLRIGGTNAAPSGTYQAAVTPSTGKEYAYDLVNDSNGEGFPLWTVTFTA